MAFTPAKWMEQVWKDSSLRANTGRVTECVWAKRALLTPKPVSLNIINGANFYLMGTLGELNEWEYVNTW